MRANRHGEANITNRAKNAAAPNIIQNKIIGIPANTNNAIIPTKQIIEVPKSD